ncbi:hypothetical protein [Clostridium diolis]|uniref:hypothetical protein n=1 Tax=Clostridium diolis TaxID=223919 RepID=UPI0019D48D61|nr:hypothetical protein [Clostridium diolis]
MEVLNMCQINRNIFIKLLAFFEHSVNETCYFEYYKNEKSEIDLDAFSVDKFLEAETKTFSLSLEENILIQLLPNYYYNIEVSNIKMEDAYLIDNKNNIRFLNELGLDIEKKWYARFHINYNVTTSVSDQFFKSKKILEKLDNLKKRLLKVYIGGISEEDNNGEYNHIEKYNNWIRKKDENKEKLYKYLDMDTLDEENMNGFDSAIKSVIPKFKIKDSQNEDNTTNNYIGNKTLQEYIKLRELLRKVKEFQNIKEEKQDFELTGIYKELLTFHGFKYISMSILLNTINNKQFPIFEPSLERYMKVVGFKIDSGEDSDIHEKTAKKYYNYQIAINQMLQSFGNYLNKDIDNYDAVNYYIKNILNLFEL